MTEIAGLHPQNPGFPPDGPKALSDSMAPLSRLGRLTAWRIE
jgi:hypothetical protein